MTMRAFLLAVTVLGCQSGFTSDNLIQNGSFEFFDGNGIPAHWSFGISRKAPVTVTPTTPGYEGDRSLCVVSRMKEKIPQTYGLLSQKVKVRPNTEYVLSYAVRGRNVDGVTWAIGRKWRPRYAIPRVTEEWREYSFAFTVTPEQLEGDDFCTLRLIVDGPCAELNLDDIRLVRRSGEIVTNGSFEGQTGQVPRGWTFRRPGNAEATATVDDSVASDGKGALRLANRTSRRANVYGALSQSVKLFPNQDYVMRVRARGKGAGVNLVVGNKWRTRLYLNGITKDWRDYELRFRLGTDDVDSRGNALLMIISEDVTPGIWLDELSVTPVEDWKLPISDWQKHRVLLVGALQNDFDKVMEIPAGTPVVKLPLSRENTSGEMPEEKNFSSEFAFLTDSVGLIFLAKVKDDVLLPGRGEKMWRSDSIQLRFDRSGLRRSTGAESDLEVGFSVSDDGRVNSWCWDAGNDSHAGRELPEELVQTHAVRLSDGYFLAARLSWKLLGNLRRNGKFGFCIAANDSDSPNQRSVYFLTPGLHDRKDASQYVQALLDTGKPLFWATVPEEPSSRELTGGLVLANFSGDLRFSVNFTDAAGRRSRRDIATVSGVKPGELVRLPFSLSIDALASGPYLAEFQVNGKLWERIQTAKIDFYNLQLESVQKFCRELGVLKKEVEAVSDKQSSLYISAPIDILERHLILLRDRLSRAEREEERRFYAEQAAMTRPDTAEALADLARRVKLLQSGGKIPQAWRFLSSPVALENGWPVAAVMDEHGSKVRRPVVFAGYGHFQDIDRDIKIFSRQGSNIVQVEIGPSSLFPREGKDIEFEPDFSETDSRLLPLMKHAVENNVKIALLISPHYLPVWFLKKYPELATSSGVLKYEVTHPKSREMLLAYIPALIGHLKASAYAEAIHSICLANEPVNTGCSPDNPYSVSEFGKYMRKKYGSVTQFNRVAGRKFKSFDEVAKNASADIAARYEFYSFSRESFTGWLRMLADAVKQVWQEIPVHNKIMVFSSTFQYVTGVDPELIGAFSTYNGNDNCLYYRRGSYLAEWNLLAMSHEMQISLNPASIVNSENHIILDRETRSIPNDHIYSAVFQQFVTGASALVTWVWADVTYPFFVRYPRANRLGNIRLRPGNIVAHAMAGLDGLRLAPELRKFFDSKPEVAILYSSTSLICSPDVYRAKVGALYTQLCFTGYRVRFLSERQLARGEFGSVKLLYAVGARHVVPEALEGMERFLASGGRIAADSESLACDPFGNPLPRRLKTEPVASLSPQSLLEQLHRHVAPLPVSLGSESDGIFFRVVPEEEGSWLVNLINYNFQPRRIRMTGKGKWVDLIQEQEASSDFSLAPLKPQLLRFIPQP